LHPRPELAHIAGDLGLVVAKYIFLFNNIAASPLELFKGVCQCHQVSVNALMEMQLTMICGRDIKYYLSSG
jgi:hypothetical protein